MCRNCLPNRKRKTAAPRVREFGVFCQMTRTLKTFRGSKEASDNIEVLYAPQPDAAATNRIIFPNLMLHTQVT